MPMHQEDLNRRPAKRKELLSLAPVKLFQQYDAQAY